MQKNSELVGWRVNGTLKKYGDRKTPDYFLRNTGIRESNFAVQLDKHWKDKLFMSFYGSTFNTEIGILRGSHIGNLTDLQEAFERNPPFFTEENFRSDIGAPRQAVNHHLIKLESKYYFAQESSLNFILAGQLNKRKEYDVRRGNRTSRPTLSLNQYTYTTDLSYQHTLEGEWLLKMGNQNTLTDNINESGTGVLPLIPNYFSWGSGFYTTLKKEWESKVVEMGIRYDHEQQRVATIGRDIPREILRFTNNYNNFNSRVGLNYLLTENQSVSFNTGYTTRNPAINELYSMGLHQGVSGIEEGDAELGIEKAWKTTIEYKYQPSSNFSVELFYYNQRFNDYIFLDPLDEFRLTIRGAFPVFKYTQTDATIQGFDVSSQLTITENFYAKAQYSFIKGEDRSNAQPLVFIPPARLTGSLTYRLKQAIRVTKLRFEDVELELNNTYVFRQKNLLDEQDFLATPNAYNLIRLKASSNLILPKFKLRAFLRIENLFNVRYRDYLNRQRYFADEQGRSIAVGINFKF